MANETVFAEYVGDYILAIALGLPFQYFAIAPMCGLSFRKGIIAATKADILSLTTFEIGLFGWMAPQRSSCTPPRTTSARTPPSTG